MEMSITSEMISKQTICGDNKGLNLNNNMESSKEQTELERMQDNLKKKQERFILNTFHRRKWPVLKATVRKRAMMGMPLIPSSCGKAIVKKEW